MPNAWFRMYGEFSTDPKVRTMDDEMQIRLVRLFCLRASGPTENLSDDELMYGLGCNVSETLRETKEVFLAKGFVDKNWGILHWNKRQFISDTSTVRVRKFREKHTKKQDETFQKQDETQNETDQNRTEQNRTDTEQIQKYSTQDKPSRGKKAEIEKIRHSEFKASILRYWESRNPSVEMPWGPSEGKNLSTWLKESPNTTVEQFTGWLRNRFKSEVNHTERPSRWIGNVTAFANGPIDRFGKPLQGENRNGNGANKIPDSIRQANIDFDARFGNQEPNGCDMPNTQPSLDSGTSSVLPFNSPKALDTRANTSVG